MLHSLLCACGRTRHRHPLLHVSSLSLLHTVSYRALTLRLLDCLVLFSLATAPRTHSTADAITLWLIVPVTCARLPSQHHLHLLTRFKNAKHWSCCLDAGTHQGARFGLCYERFDRASHRPSFFARVEFAAWDLHSCNCSSTGEKPLPAARHHMRALSPV